MDYAEMKVAAKKLGIKSVGVKKEKMLDSILDKIEEMMDVEGWVEAHQDLMTIYNAETETEAGEEEEGVETSEGIEVNEDELAEAEEKAKVAKEKADKKKAEKKEKKKGGIKNLGIGSFVMENLSKNVWSNKNNKEIELRILLIVAVRTLWFLLSPGEVA